MQIAEFKTSPKSLWREWPLVAVFGCIGFMISPVLTAEFGIIDDHEIVSIVGRSGVRTHDILPLIQERAIEQDGRFRPAYYVSRIVESFLLGSNAQLWHASRLLLALIAALALYVAIRVLMPPFPAGVVTLLLFSGSQNEIWVTLGPAESYGVPLVLIGLAWIVLQLGRRNSRPPRLFPGFALLLLAGFIKESFIPVLPAALVFTYVVLPRVIPSVIPARRRLEVLDILVFFILITGVSGQIWMTAKMLHTYGLVYFEAISPTSFLSAAKPMLMHYSRHTLWFLPVTVGLLTLIPTNKQELAGRAWRVDVTEVIVLLATAGFLILGPQWLLYAGNDYLSGRYLTPGNLFPVFAAALGLHLLWRNPVTPGQAELRGVVAGMLIAVALLNVVATYREADDAALANHRFQTKLAEIVQLKKQYPELPLLFYSTNVFDREPLVSVGTFLTVKLPSPERPFLNPFDWETAADSPLKKAVAQHIAKESLEGDAVFSAIADFHGTDGRCIAVVFSGSGPNVRCQHTVYMRDR